MPSLTELEARVAALEGRKIEVPDLPMAALMRKIEMLGLDSSALDLANALRMADGTAMAIRVGTTPGITGFGANGLTTQTVVLPKPFAAYRVFAEINDGGNASMMTHSIVMNSNDTFTIWLKNLNTVAANFSVSWMALGTF